MFCLWLQDAGTEAGKAADNVKEGASKAANAASVSSSELLMLPLSLHIK